MPHNGEIEVCNQLDCSKFDLFATYSCTDCSKTWIKSEEGQKAMTEARKQANKAIEELWKKPNYEVKIMPVVCTCCPIHGPKHLD